MLRTNIVSRFRYFFAAAFAFTTCLPATSAEPTDVKVQKLIAGLRNPLGVAIRPDTVGDSDEIFVAESGAGRIVKVFSRDSAKKTDVVAGFATDLAGDESLQAPGVQSLQFLDHNRLAVAGGDNDGKPFLRFYELPDGDTPLVADQFKHQFQPPAPDKEPRANAPTFRGIARTHPNERVGNSLVVAACSDREPAALFFIPVRGNTLADAVTLPATGAMHGRSAGGIAIAPNGFLVAAGVSSTNPLRGTKLEFINPLNRKIVMQRGLELGRVVALAFSPKSGNLYAANFPLSDDRGGGIFRLDQSSRLGTSACVAVKVADIPSPTAMAFTSEGTMYVTSSHDAQKGKPDTGALFKLTGNF
jgi:hypothetical protein